MIWVHINAFLMHSIHDSAVFKGLGKTIQTVAFLAALQQEKNDLQLHKAILIHRACWLYVSNMVVVWLRIWVSRGSGMAGPPLKETGEPQSHLNA